MQKTMNANEIKGIFNTAYQKLQEMPKEEWFEIHDNLNNWKWDNRVGEKPTGWDETPRRSESCFRFIQERARTKDRILNPICEYMTEVLTDKEILRWHHIHNLGSTDAEFERWWYVERLHLI